MDANFIQKIKDSNDSLEQKLNESRKKWGSKLLDLISQIKDISKLSESQVLMLSYRQILLEKIIEYKTILFKKNAKWDNYFKTRWEYYYTESQIKLNNTEKVTFIKSDLSEFKIQIDLITSQIEYYSECIKTLDNMAFAIRNRIQLNDNE